MAHSLADFAAGQLRAELARRQISAAEFARRLGEDEKWVGRRMRGRTAITMQDLQRIAETLGVPVTFFVPAEVAA